MADAAARPAFGCLLHLSSHLFTPFYVLRGFSHHLRSRVFLVAYVHCHPSTHTDLLYRFKVEDAKYAKDDLAAWACIRLDRLQQGYRFIRLLDAKGLASPGLLLVKIEKTLRCLGEGTPHPTMSPIMPTMSAPNLVGGGSGLTPAVRIGAKHEVWKDGESIGR